MVSAVFADLVDFEATVEAGVSVAAGAGAVAVVVGVACVALGATGLAATCTEGAVDLFG